uniref:Uncharacterized protein n=1 Tax=uncultured alpha proteobacterium HF0010_30A23 TaxID=710802 RepID=E0XRN3_9PROT|nr:hypothetical protein [uncultured alpha proteobacterium HF0010_30A23]
MLIQTSVFQRTHLAAVPHPLVLRRTAATCFNLPAPSKEPTIRRMAWRRYRPWRADEGL